MKTILTYIKKTGQVVTTSTGFELEDDDDRATKYIKLVSKELEAGLAVACCDLEVGIIPTVIKVTRGKVTILENKS